MVNTNMHEFKHPKYYKELRSIRNKLDQAISKQQATAQLERSPGPDPKLQAPSKPEPVQVLQIFNTSLKPQAASIKLQAASIKLHDPGT